jgi:hypothetical protein
MRTIRAFDAPTQRFMPILILPQKPKTKCVKGHLVFVVANIDPYHHGPLFGPNGL